MVLGSSSTSHSPCVYREWSPDQGGLRASRLRGGRRRLRSLTTPYARGHLATRVERSPAQHNNRQANVRATYNLTGRKTRTRPATPQHTRQPPWTPWPVSPVAVSIGYAALHLHHNKRGSEAAILSEPARCTPSRRCEIALISLTSNARESPGPSMTTYVLITCA